MSGLDGFLDELRKRGVVRAGLIYAAGAFAFLEFADIAFPRLGLSDAAVNGVLWLGLAGFPVVLFAAWAIELRAERDTGSMQHWLSPATVATALVLVGLGIGMGVWWGGSEEPGAGPSAALEAEPARQTTLSEREPRVAVLRFTDPGGTEEHAYFAAGLSEEISTALSRFRGIRVIAPSATGHFEAQGADVGQRASELGVAYLLRGSVRRGSERVRVSVQLLAAASGAQIWGENYDAMLETAELLSTQDRIAGRVASAVADSSGVIIRSARASARQRSGTDRFEAYDCVLLSHAYVEIHTAAVHARARDCLERAVDLEPGYADAWAHLAYSYREEYRHGFNPRPDSIERALSAGRRALELDSTNPMALFAMSQIHTSRGDSRAALVAIERAIELNPNDAMLLATLSTHLIRSGELERGREVAARTAELNPLHPGWLHTWVALYHYLRGEYALALETLARVQIQDDPQSLILEAASRGQLEQADARASLEKLTELDAGFAERPMDRLRHYFQREDTVTALTEGLRRAGLEAPDS